MKLTFGFEWEMPVLNTKFIPPKGEEIDDLIYSLRNSIKGTHTGFDWIRYFGAHMLEFRSGILRSLNECEDVIEKFFEKLKEYKEKTNFIFLPQGTYPFSGDTVGFHIHIGSFFSFKESLKYDKNLINYAPLFGAICANSSIYTKYIYGKWKSYRILFNAWFASTRNFYQKKGFESFIWGTDIWNKTILRPTIEIRIGDAPLSKEIVKDYIFFCLGAFLLNDEKLNVKRYKEYLINRLRIAQQGLQAKILWNGKEKRIDEILINKIDKIENKFSKKFNYRFKILPEMIEKRINQADFSFKTFKDTEKDILNYILKVENAFFENKFIDYLKNSKKLKILNPPDFEDIIEEFAEKDIPIYIFVEILGLPLKDIEKIIKRMEKKRIIKIKKDIIYGILISK